MEIKIKVEVNDKEGSYDYRYKTAGESTATFSIIDELAEIAVSGGMIAALVRSAIEMHKDLAIDWEEDHPEEETDD